MCSTCGGGSFSAPILTTKQRKAQYVKSSKRLLSSKYRGMSEIELLKLRQTRLNGFVSI